MSLKILPVVVLFVWGCSGVKESTPSEFKCKSNVSECTVTTSVVASQNSGRVAFTIASKFTSGQGSLIFHLEGETSELEGDIKLADGRVIRPLAPFAVLVEKRADDYDILWTSIGDTIQVSFPSPDLIRIVYDIETIDQLDLDGPHRFFKGEFTSPINVRCYTGVVGSNSGVRDSDFSSDFCKKYKKHDYQYDPILIE